MDDNGIWPVTFVCWKSRAKEALDALQKGQFEAWVGKGIHVRKGAQFAAVLEDGRILAIGEVVKITQYTYDISLQGIAANIEQAPVLSGRWLDKMKAVPRPFLKGPISGIIVRPEDKDQNLDFKWFDDVVKFARKSFAENGKSSSNAVAPVEEKSEKPNDTEEKKPDPGKDEREALLRGWIPPALSGLLEDYVRADEWELVVAYAFRALGCQVEIRGNTKPGSAEPDCIARYTSPAGQIVELIIDAKAGRWAAPVEDIRAMRDYLQLSMPYSYPLFVANTLSRDASSKLKEHVMQGKVARVVSGRDLALLIAQRLNDPNFNVEMELRRIFV